MPSCLAQQASVVAQSFDIYCDLCHVDGLGPRILLNIQLADITDITGQRLEPCGHL